MLRALVVVGVVLAGGPRPGWDFEGRQARVHARARTADAVSAEAIRQLGVRLEGDLQLKVTARPNTVGGVTLHVEDPFDERVACDFYGAVKEGRFTFADGRCSLPVFSGNLRTKAVCRRVSGTVAQVDGGLVIEARFPECNASPMGVPVTLSGELTPVR